MKISIIVPIYNVESYLRRCLDSIVHQTYQDLEIILVNDCSPDNSIAIMREYAAKDDRIIIIEHEKNLGLGGARNSGMAVASGEYIWFIDSDDEITTLSAIQEIIVQINTTQYDVVAFQYYIIHSHGLIDDKLIQKNLSDYDSNLYLNINEYKRALMKEIFPHTTVWIYWYRRALLVEYDFQFLEHVVLEDVIFILVQLVMHSLLVIDKPYYNYYVRSDSIIQLPVSKNFHLDTQRILEQFNEYYLKIHPSMNLSEKEYTAILITIFRNLYFIKPHWISLDLKEKIEAAKIYREVLAKVLLDKSILLDRKANKEYPRLKPVSIFFKEWHSSFSKDYSDKELVNIYHRVIVGHTIINASKRVKKWLKVAIPNSIYLTIKKIFYNIKNCKGYAR